MFLDVDFLAVGQTAFHLFGDHSGGSKATHQLQPRFAQLLSAALVDHDCGVLRTVLAASSNGLVWPVSDTVLYPSVSSRNSCTLIGGLQHALSTIKIPRFYLSQMMWPVPV